MKNIILSTALIIAALLISTQRCSAQMRITVFAGNIQVDGMNYSHDEVKFKPLTDSLDNRIRQNPQDTTGLFERALLYLYFNDMVAKPYQQTKGTLENLKKGIDLAQRARDLKMNDLKLKILIARLYNQMAFRFTNDQSWQYSNAQIGERRKQFNEYKTLANKGYDELETLDENNRWDYERLKVKENYPIR
ncbi:MAG TPA: hypothetical protein VHA52_07020 [Candidatus Babeliaceae bacterium]|nr:hypothetical protein [Candidatus Babeliaceae bacterium]